MSLENRMALIINENAGSVTPRMKKQLKAFAERRQGRVDLLPSSDLQTGRDNVQRVLDEGYGAVAPIGGDGTVYFLIDTCVQLGVTGDQIPNFVITKMGTGNALAGLVESTTTLERLAHLAGLTNNWRAQLEAVLQKRNLRELPHINIPLLAVEHKTSETGEFSAPSHFSFAGAGWDGAVLNNYQAFGEDYNQRWQRPFSHGLPGYLLSGFGRTLPNEWRRNSFRGASLMARGDVAYRLGHIQKGSVERYDGDELRSEKGFDLLNNIDGPVQAVLFGTTPHYGFGFTVYPRAVHGWNYEHGPLFEVRVIVGKTRSIVPTLVPKGLATWSVPDAPQVHSFFVQSAELEYWGSEESVPFQIGGDAKGNAHSVRCNVLKDVSMPAVLHYKLSS